MKLIRLNTILKIYTSLSLLIAAVFSPLSFSFVPGILLLWYLYLWLRPVSPMMDLLTHYFIFFAIPVLFSSFLSPFLSPLPALPVLVLITGSLEKAAARSSLRRTARRFSLTTLSITSLALTGGALLVAFLVTSLPLLLTCAVMVLFFITLGITIFRRFPPKPVAEQTVQLRILAGKEEFPRITLKSLSRIGGRLFVESDLSWLKVLDGNLSLKLKESTLKIAVTPSLSGTTLATLTGYAADRWGLWQTRFTLEPVKLYIIPRARYAAWLAQKYLSGTKPGALPLLSSLGAVKPLQGLRQGIEYYGNRQYQAGDSLKNIDWKHSSKYNELISKEFTEFHGQPAVALVNLDTTNAEEADKLAYNILIMALTLGQENIPVALAVYNHEKVVLTTCTLSATQLVLQSLQIVKQLGTVVSPLRYLNPPDIIKLRANINRLSQSASEPAKKLAGLLELEYQNLSENMKPHPCTRALSEVAAKVSNSASILILSQRNHDTEALAINSYLQSRKGNAVIEVK